MSFIIITMLLTGGCFQTSTPVVIERWNAAAYDDFQPPAVESQRQRTDNAPLTMDDCIRLARKHNISLKISAANLESSRIDTELAFGKYYPTSAVSATYSGTAYSDYRSFGFPSGLPIPSLDTRPAFKGSVAIRWDPDFAGVTKWSVISAQAALAATTETHRDTLRQIDLAAASLYLSIILQNRQIDTVKKSIEELEGQRDVTKRLFEQDQITHNDVLLVDVALAGRRLNLDTLQNDRRKSIQKLNQLIGLPIDHDTAIQDLNDADIPVDKLALPDAEHALAAAYYNNPALAAVRHRMESLAASTESFYRSTYPSINLSAAYLYNPSGVTDPNPKNLIAMQAELSWAMFTGGQVSGNLRKLRWQQFILRYQLRALREQIELDVRQGLMDAELARRAVDVSREAAAQAAESLRIRKQLRDNGSATQQDVLDSEEDLFAQTSRLEQNKLRFMLALKNLERAIGRPIDTVQAMPVIRRPFPDPNAMPTEFDLDTIPTVPCAKELDAHNAP